MENTRDTNHDTILRVEGISKSFPGVKALDDVSFNVKQGEVLAILGENGAGKSTLMKILSGLYQPDEGTIWIDRSWFSTKEIGELEKIDMKNPRFSMKIGIGMVYQHFKLVEPFSVTENITLGKEFTHDFKPIPNILLNQKKGHEEIKKLSEEYGLPIDPKAIVENLSVGLKQRVEILKQLYRNAELLILDEPTAVLTPSEANELFRTIQKLKETGKSIIFISHKLKEPLKIADRIVVLRKGKMVGETRPSEADEEKLAEMVVGSRVYQQVDRDVMKPGRNTLKLDNVTIKDDFSQKIVVDNVSLDVKEREILGIAGVQGNGQSELVEAIMSLQQVEAGSIKYLPDQDIGEDKLNSKEEIIDITNWSTIKILQERIAYIPEDRIQRGLILDFTLNENIYLGYYDQPQEQITHVKEEENIEEEIIDEAKLTFWQKVKHNLDPRTIWDKITIPFEFITKLSNKIIAKYQVQTPSADTFMRSLSGGNQQKVIVGREFTKDPRLIIATEPTRGVDIGVMTQIHKELITRRNEGAAILLVSSDLDEVLKLSDRIAVMYEGKIVGLRPIDEFTISEISQLMTKGSLKQEMTA